jgi:hypothetical protein
MIYVSHIVNFAILYLKLFNYSVILITRLQQSLGIIKTKLNLTSFLICYYLPKTKMPKLLEGLLRHLSVDWALSSQLEALLKSGREKNPLAHILLYHG